MHTTHSSVSFPVTQAPKSLNWKCGDIEMGNGVDGRIQEGHLADWSRRGLDLSLAFDQVQIIVTTSLHAVEALRKIVKQTVCETEVFLQGDCLDEVGLNRMDLLLRQIEDIVSEASLGDVNLLRCRSGCLNIPYLITEIRDVEDYYNFATMGMSISAVRETMPELGEMLVGIYVLSTDADKSVCWLNSPSFWVKAVGNLATGEYLAGIRNEVGAFRERLQLFDRQLLSMEQQFGQYIKMVGEVVTDLMFES